MKLLAAAMSIMMVSFIPHAALGATTTPKSVTSQPQLCQNAVTALKKRAGRIKSDKTKKLALYKQQRKLWQSKVTEADRLGINTAHQKSNLRQFDSKVALMTKMFNTEIKKSSSPKGTCAPTGKPVLVQELKTAKSSRSALNKQRKLILQFTQSSDASSIKSQHSELITKIRAKKK